MVIERYIIMFVFFFSPALKGGKKLGVLKGVFGLYVVVGCVIGLLFLFSS